MILKHHPFALAAAWLACTVSTAAEYKVDCPSSLPSESVQLSPTPKGWTPFVPFALPLHSVGVMYGPPARMAILKPDESKRSRGKTITTWTGLKSEPSEGTWITCDYGLGNEVMLSKRIDDRTTACTVTYTKDSQGGDVIDARCSW